MKMNPTHQQWMLSSTRILFLVFLFLCHTSSYSQSVTAILTGTCPGTVTLNIGADVNGKHAYSGTYQGSAAVLSWSTTNARWELSVAIPIVGGVLFFNNTNTSLDPPCHDNGVWTSLGYCTGSSITGSSGSCVSVVLPIELRLFALERSNAGHLLTWTTANEQSNKGFNVERSPQPPEGAFAAWDVLGFVNAKGKGATYDFLDATPPSGAGGVYYRLRQIDNDGKETLSKVISIQNTPSGGWGLKVYPSVTSHFLTVETTLTSDFVIVNLLGQQVMNGRIMQQIDVSTLAQGTYILKIGAEQAKFVKP